MNKKKSKPISRSTSEWTSYSEKRPIVGGRAEALSDSELLSQVMANAISAASKLVQDQASSPHRIEPPNSAKELEADRVAGEILGEVEADRNSSPEALRARQLEAIRLIRGLGAEQIAESTNARALAFGKDIFWGADAPSLNSTPGKRLLAHEVAHALIHSGSGRIYRQVGPLKPVPVSESALSALVDDIKKLVAKYEGSGDGSSQKQKRGDVARELNHRVELFYLAHRDENWEVLKKKIVKMLGLVWFDLYEIVNEFSSIKDTGAIQAYLGILPGGEVPAELEQILLLADVLKELGQEVSLASFVIEWIGLGGSLTGLLDAIPVIEGILGGVLYWRIFGGVALGGFVLSVAAGVISLGDAVTSDERLASLQGSSYAIVRYAKRTFSKISTTNVPPGIGNKDIFATSYNNTIERLNEKQDNAEVGKAMAVIGALEDAKYSLNYIFKELARMYLSNPTLTLALEMNLSWPMQSEKA